MEGFCEGGRLSVNLVYGFAVASSVKVGGDKRLNPVRTVTFCSRRNKSILSGAQL